MYSKAALLSASLFAIARGQQIGTSQAETHPTLTWSKCTKAGGCTTQNGSVTLDSNWRWVHNVGGYTNCYTGNQWSATLCPNPTTCVANCALDGAEYSTTYGITTSGNALTLKFITGTNVGSRNYLMASNTAYQMFNPLNQEFTFTVDLHTLPCGLNGALYFSEMASDGGMAAFPANKAGAQYGTGYCDSQCPRDLKFIDGQANLIGWNATSANSGKGKYGACCNEMDVWEGNSISTAYTPHPCNAKGLSMCDSTTSACTSTCDQAGCDFNSYRWGVTNFYGPGMTVDTTKPITVVTQFITSDGTATGTLTEIRRLYVQNGVTIQNSNTNLPGLGVYNSISDAFCTAQKSVTGDTDTFATYGGLTEMGQAFARGMVLVLSIWDDYAVNMLWLDSDYPLTASPTAPGVARGTCSTTSGSPSAVEAAGASVSVIYSDIRFGDIGSTYTGNPYVAPGGTAPPASSTPTTTKPASGGTTTPVPPKTTTTTASGAQQTHYGQCGGTGYTGPTVCQSPYTCKYSNAYYSQCL